MCLLLIRASVEISGPCLRHYMYSTMWYTYNQQSVNKNDKDASLTTEAVEHLQTRKTINKRQSLHPNKHTPVIQEQHCTANNKYSFVFSFRHTTRRVFSAAAERRLSKRYAMLHSTTALQTQNTIKTPQLPNIKLMSGSHFIPKSKGKNKKLYFWHF